ncbi:MAG: hypothetical protein ACJ8DZ_05620 [Allosphingosinicella sp.]
MSAVKRLAGVAGMVAAAALLAGAAPVAPKSGYAAGQVWEYRTRAGEEASRLKIQKIEALPEFARQGPVYHISIVGLHLGPGLIGVLPHAPVSAETLDASVTRLSASRPDFPSADEGTAEWQAAKGGVFTIPVAQIVAMLDETTRGVGQER